MDTRPTDDATAVPPPGPWAKGWPAPALVFFTSAAVLVIEILAGRLVAPYVGVSLETYTGIIGTVLAGIALGSAAGGRAADRHDPRLLLGPLLIASGVASLLSLPIISALGPGVAETGGGPAGIVTLAITAFVVPTALLSAVSPMVAKLRLASTADTGTVVGALSAAGSAGALVGTFATGFVFVAALPTRAIVTTVGIALIVTGLLVSVQRRPKPAVLAVVVLSAGLSQVVSSPCQHETAYFSASVVTDPDRPSGRILVLDNLHHSYVDLEDPTYLDFRYVSLFAGVVEATFGDEPLDALHIGGGGFTFPRWLAATRPSGRNVVLELDRAIVDIAEDELALEQGTRLEVHTGDARLNILEQPAAAFDLVVGDAFGGLSAPWHLTTTEMVEEVARTLRPDGLYVLNIIDGGPRWLVRAELVTLARSFEHLALVTPPEGPLGNHVLVASDAPITLGPVDPAEGRPLTGEALTRFIGQAEALTDDYAPVDRLITRR